MNDICVNPPYNATNFTSGPILSTLQTYAKNAPNYPWSTGTDAQQIYLSRQNVSYFNGINQQTSAIKLINGKQYPQFRSEAERLMYRQGQSLTSSRKNQVPCSTIYNIINS